MEHTTQQQHNAPTAILFGGGGAKGSFQIGAWHALEEAGMLHQITAAAGCSVGALNAVLFALVSCKEAKRIWNTIKPSDLLAPGAKGAFLRREGLIRMIDGMPLHHLRDSRITVYVSAQNTVTHQVEFFKLNDRPVPAIRSLLLASSAIPYIYQPEMFEGVPYTDGGVTAEGELCISPVYQAGHRNLLLLSLRSQFSVYGGRNAGALRPATTNLAQLFPECQFTVIKPMQPLGNLVTGTLNFAQKKIEANYERGYHDTQAELKKICGGKQTTENINLMLTEKMQRLFQNGIQFAEFLRLFESRFAPNVPTATMGGHIWYVDVFAVDGWRLQQHRTAGLKSHYRILNPENQRVAWVLSPNILLTALSEYEAAKK